jgi:hypothetical protein
VSRDCVISQLSVSQRSVLMVPGGCREMIRERTLVPDERAAMKIRRDASQRLCTHLLILGACSVLSLPFFYALDYPVGFWVVFTALVCASVAEVTHYVYQCATPDSGAYEIQDRHRGFLRLAYEQRVPVVQVLHHGQEEILRSYSLPRLDLLRTWFMERTGYPLPSLFMGPFPRQLTTHMYEPMKPSDYDSPDEFADAYYGLVRERYAKLCNTVT